MSDNAQRETKFLHDIASPLAIAKIMLSNCIEELEQKSLTTTPEQIRCLERIKKALNALNRIEDLHAAQKDLIVKS